MNDPERPAPHAGPGDRHRAHDDQDGTAVDGGDGGPRDGSAAPGTDAPRPLGTDTDTDTDTDGRTSAPRAPSPRARAGTAAPHPPGAPPTEQDTPERHPAHPASPEAPASAGPPTHGVLKSLLGAWALSACSPGETAAVERHLGECGLCAAEALRLRDAVRLLHPAETLDLDPGLRTRVLDSCLGRRPPRIPVPGWATPYDAETARLDALLQDFGDAEWQTPVRLRWYEDSRPHSRGTTVAGVIAHLLTVDGLVAGALGLADPLHARVRAAGSADGPAGPAARTEAYWAALLDPPTREVRTPWRDQSHALVRTVAFAAGDAAHAAGSGLLPVSYGDFELPLRDAMVDRAFECWVHATDIAEAVDYPYGPPAPRHLSRLIELGARLLPTALAARRRAGLASPPRRLGEAGAPGRSLRLEIEGAGGGDWYIPLDSPAALGSADHEVAHIALDGTEFCRLAAGHVSPEEAAAGQKGDKEAIREVLAAAAALSRL
ncbi:MDMPI N domain containing protein [Streptomyces uncialis]|uniref:MDMPI N domain containing protein n=1 Tax=Streptomyces uncialis TaxID=1048205 RepID=UPI003821ADA4